MFLLFVTLFLACQKKELLIYSVVACVHKTGNLESRIRMSEIITRLSDTLTIYIYFITNFILYTKYCFFSLLFHSFFLQIFFSKIIYIIILFFLLSIHFLDRYFDGFCLFSRKICLNFEFFLKLFSSFFFLLHSFVALLFNHRKKISI